MPLKSPEGEFGKVTTQAAALSLRLRQQQKMVLQHNFPDIHCWRTAVPGLGSMKKIWRKERGKNVTLGDSTVTVTVEEFWNNRSSNHMRGTSQENKKPENLAGFRLYILSSDTCGSFHKKRSEKWKRTTEAAPLSELSRINNLRVFDIAYIHIQKEWGVLEPGFCIIRRIPIELEIFVKPHTKTIQILPPLKAVPPAMKQKPY